MRVPILPASAFPCVAVPVSLVGPFGVMYLFGFTLDNISLMGLTVATGKAGRLDATIPFEVLIDALDRSLRHADDALFDGIDPETLPWLAGGFPVLTSRWPARRAS